MIWWSQFCDPFVMLVDERQYMTTDVKSVQSWRPEAGQLALYRWDGKQQAQAIPQCQPTYRGRMYLLRDHSNVANFVCAKSLYKNRTLACAFWFRNHLRACPIIFQLFCLYIYTSLVSAKVRRPIICGSVLLVLLLRLKNDNALGYTWCRNSSRFVVDCSNSQAWCAPDPGVSGTINTKTHGTRHCYEEGRRSTRERQRSLSRSLLRSHRWWQLADGQHAILIGSEIVLMDL